MKVAVTGASGHVGANLVRTLIEQGRKVKVLVRKDTRGLDGLNVEKIPGEVTNKDSLLRCFDGVDTVFHCAALISIDRIDANDVYHINIDGPKTIVEACLECGVKRLVHFSSIHAYSSHPEDEIIDENRQLASDKSHFPYDRSKALGQQEVLKGVEKGLDAVIVNPGAVIGPNDFKISRMGSVILDIYHRKLPMYPMGGYNWVDARDIVLGALAAEKKGRTGESYLLTGHWASFSELAAIVGRCAGIDTSRMRIPAWTAAMAAPFSIMMARITKTQPRLTPMAVRSIKMHRYISHMKATEELDYRPRPLEETVRDTLHWFEERGVLEQYAN
ncbi:MAG TPA: SDR family oxidoreductase [Spirochaetota bacterium]|nr:SDR family oxidoreductase [Spirochaetota bacterium]HPR47792.1 SDR family oxidoreductase [Spirochaetota bacterium]